jgi:putative iron-dependent peroxidase
MQTHASQAQPGVLTDPTMFAEYLTFTLIGSQPADAFCTVVSSLVGTNKAIRQKDPDAHLTITLGISAHCWDQLLPDHTLPAGLVPFTAMNDGGRTFPSTPGDLFFMIKSERMDLNFQAAKYLRQELSEIAQLIEDIQGLQYLDNREMIDFVDGTENPIDQERVEAVLVGDEQPAYAGGSYLTIQRYDDLQAKWDAQTTEHQEKVVGRTKMDNVELDDHAKPAWAHNAKSKVERDGEEIAMFRQNRPFGNAMEHGTIFVGFARSPEVVATSLQQMITADDDGNYDRLLDFIVAKTGTNYFVPPQNLIDQYVE